MKNKITLFHLELEINEKDFIGKLAVEDYKDYLLSNLILRANKRHVNSLARELNVYPKPHNVTDAIIQYFTNY